MRNILLTCCLLAPHVAAATPTGLTILEPGLCTASDVEDPLLDDGFVLPPDAVDLGGFLDERGETVIFDATGTTDRVEVVYTVDARAPERHIAGKTVRVVASPSRDSGDAIELVAGDVPLDGLELVVTYVVGSDRTLAAESISLQEEGAARSLDVHHGDLGFTATPGSCEEVGIVRFGPLPLGMPPLHFPILDDCDGTKCEDLAEAWVNLHHNVWRASQMFALMDPEPLYSKQSLWHRPGMNAQGHSSGQVTSPGYWFGDLTQERYDAVREVVHKYRDIMDTARSGIIRLRMECPIDAEETGNLCATVGPLGHHSVKGYINFCESTWTSATACGRTDIVDQVMHHEPLHHVFTHINGLKALRDNITHGHGNTCVDDVTTKPVYCEQSAQDWVGIRHFVEHGPECWHHDKIVQSVDAHAKFVLQVGNAVRSGAMTHWPQPVVTPEAPECVGEVGCLCDEVWPGDPPDGDYLPTTFCEDDEGETVCMQTKFNASQTVGVCTLCDEHRGPGCACNDVTLPCDEGSCFGDDTNGLASATGTCFVNENIPSFACLADCEELIGDDAFCMHDHPDGARCVPAATTLPEASACWESGGHMDPQTLACTTAEECSVDADCHALGYPVYFECDDSQRCVPAP